MPTKLTKVAFRFLTYLIILFIVLLGGMAGWMAFVNNHHWEAIKVLFFLIVVIIYIGFMQQCLLWLLPEKERNFWR